MDEKSIAALLLIVSALPALGMGLACVTRWWMPRQLANLSNSMQMQFVLGAGMLAIALMLVAFGILVMMLDKDAIDSITPWFIVLLNIDALFMAIVIIKNSKKMP